MLVQIMGDLLLQGEVRALRRKTGIHLLHHGCYIGALNAGSIIHRQKNRKCQGKWLLSSSPVRE